MGRSIKDKVTEEANEFVEEFKENGELRPLDELYNSNTRPYGITGDLDYQTDY